MKRDAEYQKALNEFQVKCNQNLYFAIADVRAVLNSVYMNQQAMGGVKRPKGYPNDALPSVAWEKQKEEEERLALLTPEELKAEQVKAFMEGKKYIPR